MISYFVSVFLALKFYPLVASVLMKTSLYTGIKGSILKSLMKQGPELAAKGDSQAKQAAADAIINHLPLPGFLKDTVARNIPSPSKLLGISQIMDAISGEIAKLVISLVSLVLLYLIIRVALIFARVILEGVAKLPLFRQINNLGGLGLGAVEGLLTLYIVLAVLTLFNAAAAFRPVFDAIDQSLVAKYFYEHNFIINWMFPGK